MKPLPNFGIAKGITILWLIVFILTGCTTNPSAITEVCPDDTLDLAEIDTTCHENDTIAMPVKAEDMLAKKPVKIAEIKNEKEITKQLIETVAPEKADQSIKPAAGGAAGDSLQIKFNLLTNDRLDNLEKVTVIKDIQNRFIDKSSDRVSGKFVGDAKPQYSIIEYLRRIKMTNSRKVHIKDLKTAPDGKIERIVVEEIDEATLNK